MERESARGELFQDVVNYIRENHSDRIDDAYEYFWEEEYPEEFLGGTALELAFMNFEDWMVCDYRDKEVGPFIDAYMADAGPDEEKRAALESLRDSVISLYEVVSSDGVKTLKDHVQGKEIVTGDAALARLRVGDIFAARLVEIDGEYAMGRCVYPFTQAVKDTVLEYVDSVHKRYLKNKNPRGTKREFLKDERYMFNMIWISTLFKPGE